MPELPEVETITRQLNRKTKGLVIKDVWFDWVKLLRGRISQQKFKKIIINRTILSVNRQGKNIVINLSGGWSCLIHLKLTGRILVGSEEFIKQDPYIHFKLKLSNQTYLALSDLRKFARILLEKTDKIKDLKEIKELGLNPLAKDFTFKNFENSLNTKKRGKIKEVLLEQNIIAGIGNIYASEILWAAKVNPLKDVQELTLLEKKRIYQNIKKVLIKAVEFKGSTVADKMYQDTEGKFGNYAPRLRAYHQEKCFRCQGQIKRIVQKGRSTFYCPKCQKE